MRHAGRQIAIDAIPRRHTDMQGLYCGETESGTSFQLSVQSSRRRANGHELVKAQMRSMSRGRPMTTDDIYVKQDEIYLLVGRQSRRNINFNSNGFYSFGSFHSQSLREVVKHLIDQYESSNRPPAADPASPAP